MPKISSINFGDVGGAVDSGFGALAQFSSAKGYKKAAALTEQAAEVARQSQAIKEVQQSREIFRTLGTQQAQIGAAGIANSGSALDVVRSSMQEASLTKQLLARQGALDQLGYQKEEESYKSMASAAKKSGIGGLIKTGFQVAAIAAPFISDERMKEDVRFIGRRADGIGIYHFRYKGQPTLFQGVMAQDVQKTRPEAVSEVDGVLQVDYALLGVEPLIVEET